MKNIENIMYFPIFDGKGIGDIEIRMSAKDFINKYAHHNYYYADKILNVDTFFPRQVKFIFYDSITIYIDIIDSAITEIHVYNEYKGKYENQIGIGSKISDMRNIRDDLYFDEDCILFGENPEMYMQVNEDVFRAIEGKYLYDLVVERIIIQKTDLIDSIDWQQNKKSWIKNTIWNLK